jgi:nucleoid-associated protein EbfC
VTDMRNLMKQAQQMQKRIAEAQEKLQEDTVEATAGGGMVTAVVNGRHELVSLKIQAQVVDPEDVEMLEDLVMSAINEAGRKAQEHIQSEMEKITGGIRLPGMM